MPANTISYRISLEGSEDASKKLAALGKAGEQAFKQIQDAAEPASFASTTASISKLGSTAEQAFAGATAAAQKFGASTRELQGVESIIRALAARSRDSSTSFATLAQNYDRARASAVGVGAGLVQVAAATQRAAQNTSTATRELTALSKVLSTIGLGQLASVTTSLGQVGRGFGAFGAGALAVAAAGAALVKFGVDALGVVKVLDQLSNLSGTSFQTLIAMQRGFELAGVSAKQFEAAFTSLTNKIATEAPKIGQSIEQSNLKAIQSEIALARARSAATGKDPSNFEQRRIIALANEARNIEEVIAKQEALVASANQLDDVIRQFQNMATGIRTTIDPLTSLKTQADAVIAILAKAGGSVRDFHGGLTGLPPDLQKVALAAADLFSKMDPVTRLRIGKELGIPPEVIASLATGREELERLFAAGAQTAPTDAQAQALRDLGKAWDEFTAQVSASTQQMAAQAAPSFIELLAAAKKAVSELATLPIGETLLHSLQGIGGVLKSVFVDTWIAIGAQVLDGAKKLGSDIASIFTTPIGGAWQWISDSFSSVIDSVLAKARAAWQAIKNLFSSSPGSAGGDGGGGLPFARGGWVGGRGTGTSDSNLAWLSRGEYVIPAHAVRQPGVLSLLEALRRSGGDLSRVLNRMGHFALGGMVPRQMAIPAFARGGLNGGGSSASRVLNLTIEGRSFGGLSVPEATAQSLERFAVHSQIASTGRKPSWRR
jgi:hypothetical protein